MIAEVGGAGAVGLGVGLGLGRVGSAGAGGDRLVDSTDPVPFYGAHQAGVETPQPSNLVLTAFDVTSAQVSDLSSLLRDWTAAASRMVLARPADAEDSGETAGLGPCALTVSFGVGPNLFDGRFGASVRRPSGLSALPSFPGEALEAALSGGDLVVQACATDHQVAYHAIRQLARIGSGRVRPRWQQVGFLGAVPVGTTPRNLIGFKDGTINPAIGSSAFAGTVWVDQGWLQNGTYLVVRRIRVDLEKWDAQTVADQEVVIGRSKTSGAPLSGGTERSALNLSAIDSDGVPAIPIDSHVRLAAPQSNQGASILRRAYNYDDGVDPSTGAADAGTIFLAYMADIERQFVPIQTRLAGSDRLNSFTTAIGSATFAILPGTAPGGYVGSGLFV